PLERTVGGPSRLVRRPLPLLSSGGRQLHVLQRRPAALRLAVLRRPCRHRRRRVVPARRELSGAPRGTRGAICLGRPGRLRLGRPCELLLQPLPLLPPRGQQLPALWRRPAPAAPVACESLRSRPVPPPPAFLP